MPNFSVSAVAGVVVSPWVDPATPQRPSRINPAAGRPHLRYTTPLRISAQPPIVASLVDDGGGTSFDTTAWLAEAPGLGPWPIVTTTSSPASAQFTPSAPGHHVLIVRRDAGGSVILHFDVGTT